MQQANNIFFARFVSSQICDDRSQRVFLAQMTSCIVHYDVTYHPLGVDGRAYANEFSNAYPEVYKKEGRLYLINRIVQQRNFQQFNGVMKSENAHLFKNAENSLLTFVKNPETYVPQKVTNTCIVILKFSI